MSSVDRFRSSDSPPSLGDSLAILPRSQAPLPELIEALTSVTDEAACLLVCPENLRDRWLLELRWLVPPSRVHPRRSTPPAGFKGWVVNDLSVIRRHQRLFRRTTWAGLIFDADGQRFACRLGEGSPASPATSPTVRSLLDASTLELLEAIFTGPRPERFRMVSNARSRTYYMITKEGASFECSCPGFRFKKRCPHVESIAASLEREASLPPGCFRVD
jgi:hypothetical protein